MISKPKTRYINLLVTLVSVVHLATAQITVTNATFPEVGDTLFTVVDSDPSIMIGNAEGNQTWDFRSLDGPFVRQRLFLDPAEGTALASFPDATMVAIAANEQEVYYQSFNNKIVELGRSGEFIAGIDIPAGYIETPTYRRAPISFGDVDDDDAVLFVELPADIIPPELLENVPIQFDSIRITLDSEVETQVDAWGTIMLPNSTHDVLREKAVTTTETKLFVKTILGWTELPQELLTLLGDLSEFFGTTVTESYNFYSNDRKEVIATVTMDEEDMPVRVEYMDRNVVNSIKIVTPEQNEIIAYPNPTFGNVSIQMVNYPIDHYRMEVYNVVGKKIWADDFKLTTNRVYKADLTHLSKGTYLYSIFNKNGKKLVTKRLAIMGI